MCPAMGQGPITQQNGRGKQAHAAHRSLESHPHTSLLAPLTLPTIQTLPSKHLQATKG